MHLVPGIGRNTYHQLLQHFDSPTRILETSAEELTRVTGISPALARRIATARTTINIESELKLLHQYTAEVIVFADQKNYPPNLYDVATPPAVLYKQGSLIENDKFAVTVIGSRACSPYGKLMCERIVQGLVDYGFTIVSGAATGIDTYAHRTAIKSGGRSIAILPVGLGAISSSRTRHLIAEILTHGAVLSEYPMRFPETPGNYSARNSILAGISLATVVIEAALDSGSLMTANFAVDANRYVFAVPGDITRKTSKGCNLLIKQGAKLVESAEDIVEEVQTLVGKEIRIQTVESTPAGRSTAKLNNLTPLEQRVYDIIFNSPTSFEELILIFGTEKMGELSTTLLRLEMAGIIKQLPGKVYISGK